jgi:hypothetical protein
MAKSVKMGFVKGGATAAGWIKNPGARLSATHTYHAGKAIGPSVKSAKASTSGKVKRS